MAESSGSVDRIKVGSVEIEFADTLDVYPSTAGRMLYLRLGREHSMCVVCVGASDRTEIVDGVLVVTHG